MGCTATTEKQQMKTYSRRGKTVIQATTVTCTMQDFRSSFEESTEVTETEIQRQN